MQERTLPLAILIADDSPEDADLFRTYLHRTPAHAFNLTTVETGAATLAHCRTSPPDCLLLDYHLPDMDAIDVLSTLRDTNGSLPCPVLIVTGSADEATAVGAIRAGAEDYVVKDRLNAESLRIAVRGTMERHRLRQQLAASEEQLAVMARISPVGMFRTDANGQCVYVNERWAEIADLEPDAAYGIGWVRAIHPDDRERVFAEWHAASRDKRPFHAEYRFLREGGSVVWVLGQAVVERDTTGTTAGFIGSITDITVAKEAEARQRESEALLRTVIESTPDLIWTKDRDGRITLGNRATFDLLGGGDPARVLGRGAPELVPDPAQAQQIMANDARIMASGQPETVEESFSSAPDPLIFQTVKAPLRNAAGAVVGLVGISRDVTAIKAAAEALHRNERRLRLAIEANRMVAWEWDPIADRITTTGNFAAIYGLSALAGVAEAMALVWPEDLPAHQGKVAHIAREGGGYHSQFRITRPSDGRIVWLEEHANALTDAKGTVVQVVGVVIDITERKHVEILLAQRQREFETLAEHLPDIVTRFDRALRHIYVNAAATAATGLRREDYLGRTNAELGFPPDLVQVWAERSHAAFTTEEEQAFAFTYHGPHGPRHYEARMVPEEGLDGSVETLLVVVADVTARVAAEAERTAFLDSVAHDLRNPIGVVKVQAQLVRRRLGRGSDDPARLEASLAGIEAAANTTATLIDELLDVAHLRAGRPLTLQLAPTDLGALAQTCAEEAGQRSLRHAVRIETAIPAIVGNWDAERLRRVLRNLLDNAVKYSPDGGEILVRVSRMKDQAGHWAELTVTDQGVGIPADDLGRVFLRFHRGGNVAGIAGSGIGLAGSKQIVEQHGGTIGVESIEGYGSTFSVRLPLQPTVTSLPPVQELP